MYYVRTRMLVTIHIVMEYNGLAFVLCRKLGGGGNCEYGSVDRPGGRREF